MRVLSREPTALAYDGIDYRDGEPVLPRRPGKVVIRPGYSTISPEGEDLLRTDPNFARAVDAGIIVIDPEGDVEANAADESFELVEEVGGVAVDPRARLDGESDKDYNKRMKALDRKATEDAAAAVAADKPRVDFLATFNGLGDRTAQDAVYPTLTDEEKAWVDADRATADAKGA